MPMSNTLSYVKRVQRRGGEGGEGKNKVCVQEKITHKNIPFLTKLSVRFRDKALPN